MGSWSSSAFAQGGGEGGDMMPGNSAVYTEAGWNKPRSQGLLRFGKGPGNEIDDGWWRNEVSFENADTENEQSCPAWLDWLVHFVEK